MGLILEIILSLFIEIIAQLIFQFLIFLGFDSVNASFQSPKSTNDNFALIGCLIIGAIVGLISYVAYPKRFFNIEYLYGISLVVSPIIVGLVMKVWGEKRLETNKRISVLSTFWGGAIFAFGYSLVRFLLIK